ncbi:MAG TPA: RDD family protein [Candidatus Limnocylindrales bacterium]
MVQGAGPSPWAPVQPGGSWGTPPPDGGGRYAVPGAPGLVYAGALPRAAAWIVDGLLVGIVAGIVSAPFASPMALDANGAPDFSRMASQGGISALISTLIGAGYFILLWTTAGRATLGMRLFSLQVGNAADGTKLRIDQAAKRWLAFGSWLGIIPLVGLFEVVWQLVLLATTISSPTKQGLHDRFAGSAVVRPASAGNGLAIACLVIVLVIPIALVLLIIPLIFLGGQVSAILSAVGDSV